MKKIKKYIKAVIKKLYRALYKISPKPCKKILLKCKALVRRKKNSRFMPTVSISNDNFAENQSFALNSVPFAKTSKGSIAVQMHIDYFSIIPEFFKYLNNIPYPFDLYISCYENEDTMRTIESTFSELLYVKKIVVRKSPVRDRDASSVFVLFAKELSQYEYICHIHSKAPLYPTPNVDILRRYCLDSILGSSNHVKRIFSIFDSNLSIGLVYPENTQDAYTKHWLGNVSIGTTVLESMGLEFEDCIFDYPVCGFYWAKTDAIRPLFDRAFTYEDMPFEQGKVDGTVSHVINRALTFVSRSEHYHSAIIDIPDDLVRVDSSNKCFNSYFSATKESAYDYIQGFEYITFDIFDTLVTYRVFDSSDILRIVALKVRDTLGLTCDFVSVRKKAEALAKSELGVRATIHDIYAKIPSVSDIAPSVSDTIKQIELDTELEYIIPRADMLWLFNQLVSSGKSVTLLTDSYLTSDILGNMLSKCGYHGWVDIIVSCECGCQKCNSAMCDWYLQAHEAHKCVHIGDEFYSDVQIPRDRGINTFYVLSPVDAMSRLNYAYGILSHYDREYLSSSLMLGDIVNAHLFNNAFCFNPDGTIKDVGLDVSRHIFGPILLSFTQHIHTNAVQNKDQLLFLAREGYLLEPMYREYCKAIGEKPCDSVYLLTSRRASSVPTIQTEQDVREIMSRFYVGRLDNMLESRLGYTDGVAKTRGDYHVDTTDGVDKVMRIIRPELDNIYAMASREKELYLEYLNSVIAGHNHIAVVDLGYSGTIQYYLSKLLDKKLGGYYLLTDMVVGYRPRKLGCRECSLFKKESEEYDISSFECLFLEGLLQAPYGQFVCFKKNGKRVEKVYRSDMYYPEELKTMQDCVKSYVVDTARYLNTTLGSLDIDKDLCKSIFLNLIKEESFLRIAQILNVQDSYCRNGIQVYDGHQWVVKKK